MNRESFWSSGIVAALSVFIIVWVIPQYGGRGATYGMPPQLLPSIAGWIMLVCSSIVFVRSAIAVHRSREGFVTGIPWSKAWGSCWPFLYVGGTIIILSFIPLMYAGALIIGVMLVILGERRPLLILSCSVGPVIFLYLIANNMMRIGIV